MAKIARKKLRFQLKNSAKRGRRGRDSIVCAIANLVRVMARKLKRLSSERFRPPTELLGARKLELILIGNKYNPNRGQFRQVSRKFTVPRPRGSEPMPIVCNFWHELDRKSMEFMALMACKKTRRNLQKVASSVALRASHFCLIESKQAKFERQTKRMEEYNVPYDPYKPLTEEQIRILNDLPLFRRPNQVPELMFPAQPLDPSRLKQTKISDYFNAIRLPHTK